MSRLIHEIAVACYFAAEQMRHQRGEVELLVTLKADAYADLRQEVEVSEFGYLDSRDNRIMGHRFVVEPLQSLDFIVWCVAAWRDTRDDPLSDEEVAAVERACPY